MKMQRKCAGEACRRVRREACRGVRREACRGVCREGSAQGSVQCAGAIMSTNQFAMAVHEPVGVEGCIIYDF